MRSTAFPYRIPPVVDHFPRECLALAAPWPSEWPSDKQRALRSSHRWASIPASRSSPCARLVSLCACLPHQRTGAERAQPWGPGAGEGAAERLDRSDPSGRHSGPLEGSRRQGPSGYPDHSGRPHRADAGVVEAPGLQGCCKNDGTAVRRCIPISRKREQSVSVNRARERWCSARARDRPREDRRAPRSLP